ncbi:MAG: DNA replication/repair protein RecF [Mycobacteriales bacterium]
MLVSHLSLTDFRSYQQADLTLTAGASVFLGPNGVGKTNILEALGYLAGLDSHRAAADAPLVRAGAPAAVLRATVRREGRDLLLEVAIQPGRANRARLNQASLPRPREILGVLRTVLFAPEDLALVKGEPEGRRRFLDGVLCSRTPRYAAVRADYDRVLRQRNALLRTAAGARRAGSRGDLDTLSVWDAHLARHGAELLAGRLELVEALRPLVEKSYTALAPPTSEAAIAYTTSVPLDHQDGPAPDRDALAAALLEELHRVRPQELDRGISLAGPHRDDVVLSLGEFPARGYASHGEAWSLALALRLASYELLQSDGGEPVLLLDDVFAELDDGRRQRLAAFVVPAEQVLVTAAVPEDVPGELGATVFQVRPGEVSRASP